MSNDQENADDDKANALRTAALMRYEPWLRLIAKLEIDHRFQDKFSPSDVVQQTLMEAWRNWDEFEPHGEPQEARMAWLRRVLANQLAMQQRRFSAQKRDVKREVSIDQSLTNVSLRLEGLLAANVSSPSHHAMRHENALRLAELLERLPEDYREVIVLRNLEERSHAEIAEQMNRSEGSVRMLWVRALAKLKEEIDRGRGEV